MGRNCCHVSLAFVLKFFNFLQAFIGISIIIYSIWMLDQWNHSVPVFPPSSSSSSPHSSFSSSSLLLFPSSESHSSRDLIFSDVVPRLENWPDFDFNSFQLPAPWFIYSFMAVGAILCCIAFIGCIAAESINGCCLCCYTIVKILLILLEAVLVAFIAIDRHWEKDLPFDPTGELQSLRIFIEENVDICKWVGITVLIIQALALLLAMILRAMVSTRRNEFDEDDFENVRRRTREPFLIHSGQTFGSGTPSDIWSSRMREKYGLNTGDKPNLLNQNASMSMKST